MPAVNYNLTRTWNWVYPFRIDHGELQDHPLFRQAPGYGRERAYLMMGPFRSGVLNWHIDYWRALTEDYRWNGTFARPQSFVTIPTDANILFVGSGFGYLAEAARSLGWTNLALMDDSNWIHDHKADLAWRWDTDTEQWVQDTPNAIESIIQNPFDNAQQVKNALKPVFNNVTGEPDWIITESVISGLIHPSMGENFQPGEGDSDELTPFFGVCDGVIAAGGTVLHMADLTVRAPFNVLTLAEWKALNPAHRFAPSGYYVRDWEIL